MNRWCLGGSVVVLVLVALSGCTRVPVGTSGSSSATPCAESVQCTRSPDDLAEIRRRNRDRPPFTAAELHGLMNEPDHAAHLKLWRDRRSYYALLEIVEGIIQPELGRIRQQDVRELLGDGPTYNNQARTLEYAGERPLPYGNHAVIEFDQRDTVTNVDWVSE